MNKKVVISWAVFSLVFSGLIFGVSRCINIPEDQLTDLLDETQRTLRRNNIKVPRELNDYIINTPYLLDRRVKRTVDRAIEQYEIDESETYKTNMKDSTILNQKFQFDDQKLIIDKAVYYEFAPDNSQAQESLGGVMGIRSEWVPPDPRELDKP
jgi:hypothetical protein